MCPALSRLVHPSLSTGIGIRFVHYMPLSNDGKKKHTGILDVFFCSAVPNHMIVDVMGSRKADCSINWRTDDGNKYTLHSTNRCAAAHFTTPTCHHGSFFSFPSFHLVLIKSAGETFVRGLL